MTGRLKLLAAALGLVLATGSIANVSAATRADTKPVQATTQMQTKTPSKLTHRAALRSHRLHLAHLRHAHALRLARHHTGTRLVKVGLGTRATKLAGTSTIHRERHAMNHHVTTKPSSVIR